MVLRHLDGDTAVTRDLMAERTRIPPWVTSFSRPAVSTSAAGQIRMQGIEPTVRVITGSFLRGPRPDHRLGRLAAWSSTGLVPMADPACPAMLMHGQTLVEAISWPRPDDDREHVCFRAADARALAWPSERTR